MKTKSDVRAAGRASGFRAAVRRAVQAAVAAAAVTSLGACVELGGASQSESKPGNAPDGNVLGSSIVLSEDGRYLVAQVADPKAPVWSADLQTFTSVPLAAAPGAHRMVFGQEHRGYFVAGVTADSSVVTEVSLATGKRGREWKIPAAADRIGVDAAGQRLAVWSSAWVRDESEDPRPWKVTTVHLGTGKAVTRGFEGAVADVRWTHTPGELAVVERLPDQRSRVTLYEPYGEATRSFEVPNCASSLEIAPDGRTAMLAPTTCEKDPISIIDMVDKRFVENLPGFGPVAYAPDGETAIGFARRADLAAVGVETSALYSLLFVDVATRQWEVLELGDSQPIYQVTPDGEVVLLFSVLHDASYDGLVLVDVETRTLRETSGPEVDLYEYVMTPDGEVVYLVDGGLFRLDVETGAIVYVSIDCRTPGTPTRCNPDLVNLLPDGETLILGYLHDAEFALYDIPSATLEKTFVVGPSAPIVGGEVGGL